MAKQGGAILVLFFLSIGLFLIPIKFIAVDKSVVINEIVWMGTTNSVNEEWMELKNLTDHEILLDGWVLSARDGQPTINLSGHIAPNGYFLLERTSDETVAGVPADLIYTGALSNSGEYLELKDANGNVVDQIDASGGWTAGDNATKQTMERNNIDGWQNSLLVGGTPKSQNSILGGEDDETEYENDQVFCGNGLVEDNEECDDNNNVNGDGCDAACEKEKNQNNDATSTVTIIATTTPSQNIEPTLKVNFKWGEVLINELMSDPGDGDEEWIEIYNTTELEVDLSDWVIEDGGGTKTKLNGELGVIGNSRFFVVNKPAGNLNNKGDLVTLKFKDIIIDSVAYGDWDDGNKDNNAPIAADPFSLARKSDGYNSFNNKNDFSVTTKSTKGGSNIIVLSEEEIEINDIDRQASDNIVITEIFPNPIGDDTDGEFIELYNKGDNDINLVGWKLGDATTKRYQFKKDTTIKAHNFLVIKRKESNLALNNDEETVKLFSPTLDEPVKTVVYEDAPENQSWNNLNFIKENIDNKNFLEIVHRWAWSELKTPGEANDIQRIDQPPVVDFEAPSEIEIGKPFIYDSSDTTDDGTSSLRYFWDFSDGATSTLISPEHTYFKVGAYKVKLVVSDGKNESEKIKTIKVLKTGALASKGGVIVKGASFNVDKEIAAKTITKKTVSKTTTKKKSVSQPFVSVKLNDVQSLAKGDKVRTEGVVAVLPGVFGSQYFYIVGSGGVQIYNYKKDFPLLKIGDYVLVSGEISMISGETRIKTDSKDDIKVIENRQNPRAEAVSCEEIDDKNIGSLVSVVGEVTEKKGYTIFLDDGTSETQVYLKKMTGLVGSDFTEGEKIEVRGIVGRSGENLRIMPRSKEDVIKQSIEEGKVLGEVSSSNEWQLAQRDKKTEMLKYFLAILFFVVVVLVFFINKKHGR